MKHITICNKWQAKTLYQSLMAMLWLNCWSRRPRVLLVAGDAITSYACSGRLKGIFLNKISAKKKKQNFHTYVFVAGVASDGA